MKKYVCEIIKDTISESSFTFAAKYTKPNGKPDVLIFVFSSLAPNKKVQETFLNILINKPKYIEAYVDNMMTYPIRGLKILSKPVHRPFLVIQTGVYG